MGLSMHINQTMTGIDVDHEAREMARKILEMRNSWKGASRQHMQGFPSPGFD